jgi:hypothetical protein
MKTHKRKTRKYKQTGGALSDYLPDMSNISNIFGNSSSVDSSNNYSNMSSTSSNVVSIAKEKWNNIMSYFNSTNTGTGINNYTNSVVGGARRYKKTFTKKRRYTRKK